MESNEEDVERALFEHTTENAHALGNNTSKVQIECEEQDELIYFNVSGQIFVTTAYTLNVFPNALFGTKEKRDQLPRTKHGEIFINRHPIIFSCVLTFYQTGIFEMPLGVNQKIFVSDVSFYGLEEQARECGLHGFTLHYPPMPKRKLQAYVWQLLEYPDTSLPARIVSVFSLGIIIVSIVIFCWETLPAYRPPYSKLPKDKQMTVRAIKDIEIFCITYFSLELLCRFGFSPNKFRFVKNILNIIDLISILPFFVTLIFTHTHEASISIYFLRAIRLVRVFRIFKLSRHSSEMKILGIAVKDSARELGVLLFFILLGVLLFSSAMYYAENAKPGNDLDSIPGAFWWSIVTMTTIGYGDVYPRSTAGKLVGAVCAMTGILVIAMPIPIIVNNFTRHYQRLKPVSKFWEEFQEREQSLPILRRSVSGLFKLEELERETIAMNSNMLDKYASPEINCHNSNGSLYSRDQSCI